MHRGPWRSIGLRGTVKSWPSCHIVVVQNVRFWNREHVDRTLLAGPVQIPKSTMAFDDCGHTHAESDAQGRQAAMKVLAFHLVQHRGDEPSTAHPERMAQANRSSIHVQLRVLESNRG